MKHSLAEARAVIDASLAGGINIADTAEGYGDSEAKLAYALKKDRGSFIMATKSMKRTAREMARMVDQSLQRFETDYIDIYQIHALQTGAELRQVLAPGGALEALRQAQQAGKVRYIGVTGHRSSTLVDAIKTGEFDTVMAPINVVDRESEEELLPLARKLDIGILAMKPVCGGTLDDPALGIRFCLNSITDTVLVGMKNVAEVEANLKTANEFRPLSPLEEDELLENASQLGNTFCRRCEYCQPCPENIHIPRILWLANYHRRYASRDPWTEDEYRALTPDATACQECGECEDKCPYDLPIRQMLKEANVELMPDSKTVAKRKVKKLVKRIVNRRDSV